MYTWMIVLGIAFTFLMTVLGASLVFCFKKDVSSKLNTAFLGIAPNVENYKKGDCFDLVAGCLVDEPPVHRQYLSSQDTENFIELLNVDFSSL